MGLGGALPGFGWLVPCSVADSINTNADSQAVQLQSYNALGNSEAWGPGCLQLGVGFACLGRGGAKGDQETIKILRSSLLACAACLSISFSACSLWVLPGDKRPEQSAEESLPPH